MTGYYGILSNKSSLLLGIDYRKTVIRDFIVQPEIG
jgi:hypothetical protein